MKISNLLYMGALSTLALVSCTTTTTTANGTEVKASYLPLPSSQECQVTLGMQTTR